ncbi:Uricase [Sesbania bispinosa]|nr:Uricase [Sesbania bispinosa]
MAKEVEGFKFEQRHGKERVRVARVWKAKDGRHFIVEWRVTTAIVNIVEKPWERVSVDGQPHQHVIKSEIFWRKIFIVEDYQVWFEGFIRDKYTALPETRERMLATEVTALWRYTYESLYSIPQKPLYFTDRYLDVKRVLTDTFFGSPKEGVYSPSVQSTLYQMAKAALNRFPDIASVQLKMPNIHFIPVNISNKDGPIVKVLILFPEKLAEVSAPITNS